MKEAKIKRVLSPLLVAGAFLVGPTQVLLLWLGKGGDWAVPMVMANFFFVFYSLFQLRFRWREDQTILILAFLPTASSPWLGLTGLWNDMSPWTLVLLLLSIYHLLSVAMFYFWLPKLRLKGNELSVGKAMPYFVLDDLEGNPVSNSILGKGPILFFFFRGNWCPFCSTQIQQLVKGYREIEDAGLRLAFVSSQPQNEMRLLSEKNGLGFLYLMDNQNRFSRSHGLIDEGGVPPGLGRFGENTILPTLVFVDHRGTILLVERTDNARFRPDPDKILEKVRLLEMTAYLEEKVTERTKDLEVEREKSDKLLRNILPEHTAAELKAKGKTEARHYDDVTILYADFVGFSSLTANLPPQKVLDAVNAYFERYDEAVETSGLEKIKTIGDAYMVAGGVPLRRKDHAMACSKLAIEILRINRELEGERAAKGLITFKSRIGLHTGPVMAGVAGTTKFCYDIWGESVNLAARMEAESQPDRINISQATLDLLPETVQTEARGLVKVKNLGSREMFFLNALDN